jgi:enoyl-CoA hydratase/carnithine racemase/predicted RNase H-like HicB family nuclease
MLLDFFLERSQIELDKEGLTYRGRVPDLPEIRVQAATPDECRAKLARAIADVLAGDAESTSTGALPPRSFGSPVVDIASKLPQTAPSEPGSDFTDILYEKRDWVARVIINRPEVYNAYSAATLREMATAFRDAAADESVAVLVLTGAGDRAFCAGSDVKEHTENHLGRPDQYRNWMGLLIEAHTTLMNLGKPTIARINGLVAGGGNEWNLACDLAVAADHARFLHIETSVGMVAATGATQWLPLLIGDRRAREMLLTGEPIPASRALEWGLVNDVVPMAELDGAVEALCRKLIDRFPECTRYTRRQLNFWKNHVWEATIDEAREWLARHFAGPEAKEGLTALAQGRAISYRRSSSDASTGINPPSAPLAPQRVCRKCGAGSLPSIFEYCGLCGSKLD